jgi:ubiquinone/menaquinone biosynthesis C-methylase UbiE
VVTPGDPPLEFALQAINAHWLTSAVAAAVTHNVFGFLERGPANAAELAQGCSISERGARALLEALLGAKLVTVDGERFSNSPTAACYFVKGKPLYLGELAKLSMQLMIRAAQFPEAIAQGRAETGLKSNVEMPQWPALVRATTPFSIPVAELLAEQLGSAQHDRPLQILDVGGGAGIFSVALLKANAQARATQLDWPSVNAVARDYVAQHELQERFRTVDGDFLRFDYKPAEYDIIVYSHMAHGLSKAENQRAFALFHAALKSTGVLVINDLLPELDGSAGMQALLSSARTFYATESGAGYRFSEYEAMLKASGFRDVSRSDTRTPTTLIMARP